MLLRRFVRYRKKKIFRVVPCNFFEIARNQNFTQNGRYNIERENHCISTLSLSFVGVLFDSLFQKNRVFIFSPAQKRLGGLKTSQLFFGSSLCFFEEEAKGRTKKQKHFLPRLSSSIFPKKTILPALSLSLWEKDRAGKIVFWREGKKREYAFAFLFQKSESIPVLLPKKQKHRSPSAFFLKKKEKASLLWRRSKTDAFAFLFQKNSWEV